MRRECDPKWERLASGSVLRRLDLAAETYHLHEGSAGPPDTNRSGAPSGAAVQWMLKIILALGSRNPLILRKSPTEGASMRDLMEPLR